MVVNFFSDGSDEECAQTTSKEYMPSQHSVKINALYAGSFDPIHLGHIDIIKRAAKAFGELEVTVGINPAKRYMFSLEERVQLVKQALQDIRTVRVTSFRGILARYAAQYGVPIIVRGIRDHQDYQAEILAHNIGNSQAQGIETVFFTTRPEFSHISSSAVKFLQQEHADIHKYVPLLVKQKLEERVSGQYIVGITGETGSGKSYIGQRFVELRRQKGIEVHNIELDRIGHEILSDLERYKEVREKIIEELGEKILFSDKNIDRQKLSEVVLFNRKSLEHLNQIMHKPILLELQERMYEKKGLILINTALLAETNTSYICNNNVVITKTPNTLRIRRLKEKGWSEKRIRAINEAQYSVENKEKILKREIEKEKHGHLWIYDNLEGGNLEEIFQEVIEKLGVI